MNNYKVIITQRAFSDISECVLFVNAVSHEAAQKIYREIIDAIDSLKTFPFAYSNIEGLKIRDVKIKRMPIHQVRYMILYKIEGNDVVVYDIVDSRQDNSVLKV